jgi:hypothetical protein
MCGLRSFCIRRNSMDDTQDPVLPLGDSTVVLRSGDETLRFRVNSASLTALTGRRRVRVSFDGPRGSVTIEISKTRFWQLTAVFHDRSISTDSKQPPRKRGKRS